MVSLHEAGEKASDETPELPAAEMMVMPEAEEVMEMAELRIEE